MIYVNKIICGMRELIMYKICHLYIVAIDAKLN